MSEDQNKNKTDLVAKEDSAIQDDVVSENNNPNTNPVENSEPVPETKAVEDDDFTEEVGVTQESSDNVQDDFTEEVVGEAESSLQVPNDIPNESVNDGSLGGEPKVESQNVAQAPEQAQASSLEADATEEEKTLVPEVKSALSKVAGNPKSSMAILAGLVLIFLYLVLNMFQDEEPPAPEVEKPKQIFKPTTSQDSISGTRAMQEKPKLPELKAPKAAPPPPSVAQQASASVALPGSTQAESLQLPTSSAPKIMSDEQKQRNQARRQSSIVLIAGVPQKSQEEVEAQENFKFRGDLERILGKGKIIDAVLETALSTDFGGDVRAVVSRDVFSQGGKMVLVPKGARVFGSYSTGIDGAFGRISVTWNRIDLPNGFSVNLAGKTVDNLGRDGVAGRVDMKYTEKFSNAVLTSAFNIALAGALDKIIPPPITATSAAQTDNTSKSVTSAATSIFTDNQAYPTDQSKITAICSQVPGAISDKTSAMYQTVQALCSTAQQAGNNNQAIALQQLITGLNSLSSSTSTATAQAATPSKEQKASEDAFKNITGTVKDMITQEDFKPTITVNQGEKVRIYVNRDYVFPKKVSDSTTRILQ